MRCKLITPVSLPNLRSGIQALYEYHRKKRRENFRKGNWDFHNSLYERLGHERRRGLDENFWRFLVDELARWKAFRGKKGITKQCIYDKGIERLERLRAHYAPLSACCTQLDFGLQQVTWREVSSLFGVALEIKAVKSPVFASKLCHFLCPSIFPVFDNTLVKTGKIEYMEYWIECKKRWEEAPEKSTLIQELMREIPIVPHQYYPWSTKIFELCQYVQKS